MALPGNVIVVKVLVDILPPHLIEIHPFTKNIDASRITLSQGLS
jgi:hypothetical protein